MSIGVTVELTLDGWPSEQVDAALFLIRTRVLADVATTGLEVELAFRVEDGEVVASAFGGEHDLPVHLEDGVETACAWVASELQDGVADRLNRAWPELVDGDGMFVGVLEPTAAGGVAVWAVRGVAFCAVGQLAGAVPARGHRLVRAGDPAGRLSGPGG
jgi:hypothetical protein